METEQELKAKGDAMTRSLPSIMLFLLATAPAASQDDCLTPACTTSGMTRSCIDTVSLIDVGTVIGETPTGPGVSCDATPVMGSTIRFRADRTTGATGSASCRWTINLPAFPASDRFCVIDNADGLPVELLDFSVGDEKTAVPDLDGQR